MKSEIAAIGSWVIGGVDYIIENSMLESAEYNNALVANKSSILLSDLAFTARLWVVRLLYVLL